MGARILKMEVTLQLYATISQWMKKLDFGLIESVCHGIDILEHCAMGGMVWLTDTGRRTVNIPMILVAMSLLAMEKQWHIFAKLKQKLEWTYRHLNFSNWMVFLRETSENFRGANRLSTQKMFLMFWMLRNFVVLLVVSVWPTSGEDRRVGSSSRHTAIRTCLRTSANCQRKV